MSNNGPIDIGQDAFLDIIANLVGILIILVVVIGAQATTAWQQPTDKSKHQAKISELEMIANKKGDVFESMRQENHELKRKLAEENAINKQLASIRQEILVGLESRRTAIEQRKSSLSHVQQANLIAEAQIQGLRNKIKQVRYEANAVKQNLKPVVQTIQHYPTPIARTVFSDEIHFRLKGGRIAYVPLDELVDAMKNSWRENASQIRRAKNTSEEVGPIENFHLQYETQVIKESGSGRVRGVAMKQFVLHPIHDFIGEEIDRAIASGSVFRNRIARLTPRKTTISLWVYPDGYEDLERLQALLREAGFQTACWPLKYDGLISGGPQGFRTTTN